MQSEHHQIANHDGWKLSLHQTWDPSTFQPARRPVLIVPGYGMNSFIFSFHPRGVSLEGYLASRGFEVWRADLRGQGDSTRVGGSKNWGLADLSATDLTAVLDAVRLRTRSERGASTRVDVIGASLGATILFGHAALKGTGRLGSLVSLGGPLRWVKVHPLVRAAFRSQTVAGMLELRGTRKIAGVALPLLAKHAPGFLGIYLNPTITDTGPAAAREMVRTVEDPNRFINREIAGWIRSADLSLRGTNVTQSVRELPHPLLTVVANGDGIVPPETAGFPHAFIDAPSKDLLYVGDESVSIAHADLFVSDEAQERVFRPIADWLLAHERREAL